MLTLFSYIIHYHMASQSEAELKQYYQLLASLRFPSMLINVLMIDTLSNRVQVIILDILDALVSGIVVSYLLI